VVDGDRDRQRVVQRVAEPAHEQPDDGEPGGGGHQNTVKPAALSASAPSSTRGAANRSSSRVPSSRPRNIPPMIADSAAVATRARRSRGAQFVAGPQVEAHLDRAGRHHAVHANQ
jgi:hypothetical protein